VQEDSVSRLQSAPILPIVITNQYFCSGIAFCGVPVLHFEYLLQRLSQKPFRKILRQLAEAAQLDRSPYLEPYDAILNSDLKALPLAEYADVSSRVIPDEKRFSLRFDGDQFEERHFRIRSRYDAGTFHSTPGTAFRFV
jgi:hypothetical protein